MFGSQVVVKEGLEEYSQSMPLPSYRSLRKDINTLIEYASKQAIAQKMGTFGGLGNSVQHEGDAARFVGDDGSEHVVDYKEVVSERVVTDEELMTMQFADIIQMASNLGTDLGDQQARGVFEAVNQATEAVGNVLKTNGEKFTMEHFFKSLEMIDIDFDEEGNPKMPTMYIHPSMSERMKEVMETEADTPENNKRHEELMKKKREEFDARESHRKLVD